MSITSAQPTSRRGYVSKEELAEYTGAVLNTLSDELLGKAEEIIDGFVGFHKRFLANPLNGKVASATGKNVTLESIHQNTFQNDYFTYCEIEIVGGTGKGQRRKIVSSTIAGVVVVDVDWTTPLDATSYYNIYQLGKFPRDCDFVFDNRNIPNSYYKNIPEAIKRATCAQYEYMVELGTNFFAGALDNKASETIGDYSYTNAKGEMNVNNMVSNKVKILLAGYTKRTGRIVV